MNYVKIANLTASAIVINSCKIILKPIGEPGDSIITEKDKRLDKDVIGLVNAGFAQITSVPKLPAKKIKTIEDVVEKPKKGRGKAKKEKASQVTYIDHGHIKKANMTKHQEAIIMVNSNGEEVIEEDEDGEGESAPEFIDPNPKP